mgnify:CR=1 FL=1
MDGFQSFESSLMEHRFWIQIMGDHARFIFFSLSPNEVEHLQRSQDFIISFDDNLEKINQSTNSKELELITNQAFQLILQFREYKLFLLSETLTSNIKMHLSSSIINDMINELDEYLNILHLTKNDNKILFHPLHYHLLWLKDAIGHAASILASLDYTEKGLIDKASSYEMQFTVLLLKATMMRGFLRTQLKDFPSLIRLNKQIETLMISFKEFLEDLRDQRMDGQVLGTLSPFMADHMAREECYYLWKLSLTSGLTKRPDCDPARPRIGE